jgi:hypothetical protein
MDTTQVGLIPLWATLFSRNGACLGVVPRNRPVARTVGEWHVRWGCLFRADQGGAVGSDQCTPVSCSDTSHSRRASSRSWDAALDSTRTGSP